MGAGHGLAEERITERRTWQLLVGAALERIQPACKKRARRCLPEPVAAEPAAISLASDGEDDDDRHGE